MIKKVYIQSLNNFPIADWALSAYIGLKGGGLDIIFFENIEEVPTSKYYMVVADIESTNSYLARLGKGPKKALNIPVELDYDFYKQRWVKRMTLGEFRKDPTFPVFIKPDGKAKEFIAGVMSKPDTLEWNFKGISDDCPILISEVVDIVSEYRCYVIDGKIEGVYWYLGDFWVFPDRGIVEEMVRKYTKAPAGYSLDVGILADGRTVLIECNDGWSLGNYGLDPSKYAKLLTKRWIELMKN